VYAWSYAWPSLINTPISDFGRLSCSAISSYARHWFWFSQDLSVASKYSPALLPHPYLLRSSAQGEPWERVKSLCLSCIVSPVSVSVPPLHADAGAVFMCLLLLDLLLFLTILISSYLQKTWLKVDLWRCSGLWIGRWQTAVWNAVIMIYDLGFCCCDCDVVIADRVCCFCSKNGALLNWFLIIAHNRAPLSLGAARGRLCWTIRHWKPMSLVRDRMAPSIPTPRVKQWIMDPAL